MIEFDVESTGLQPWSGKQVAFSMQFWDGDEPKDRAEFLVTATAGIHTAKPEDIERVKYWLERGAKEGIRAHNAKFDRAFGEVTLPDLPWPGDGCWHDSMVTAQAINERRSNALKKLGDELLGGGASDLQKQVHEWLSKELARRRKAVRASGEELVEPNFADVPLELIVPYGLEDVYLQRGISDHMQPLLDQSPEIAAVVERERKVLDALYAVEKRGLPADEHGYRKLEVEVIENLDPLLERVVALAREGLGEDAEFNPNSTPQIIQALEARNADLTYVSREKGKVVSVDREQLEAVDDELAAAILDFRSEYKVLSTYVRPYIGRHYDKQLRVWKEQFIATDGRIHANYRQVGARTGRMSCSDPNMQNQPRDDLRLRYNIRAEPGYKLVACDLSNIEMRLFAAYAGKGRLIDAVREGTDLHTLTAKMVGIHDRKRAGGAVESARQRGKTFNFSVIYGGGLRTIRRQQRVDQEGARRMQCRYYDAYPEVKNLQNRIEHKLIQQGYIKDLWGRRYRCPPDRARKESYKFVNYLIQGSAAQVLKDALVDLHVAGVPVVALVHDEIIAHVPEADAIEAQETIIQALIKHGQPGGALWLDVRKDRDGNELPAGPVVPLDAEGDIVDRWSQAKKPDFVPQWAT